LIANKIIRTEEFSYYVTSSLEQYQVQEKFQGKALTQRLGESKLLELSFQIDGCWITVTIKYELPVYGKNDYETNQER
jgi:hypothetical protein